MFWYEDEISKLESSVKSPNGPVAESAKPPVIFYGSSSIRLWLTLAQDFPEVNLINLGFGGSTLAACAWFFERVVVPVAPRSIVLYAGDNDLGDGRLPEEVYLFFNAFAEKMQRYLPGVPLTFLSIKISPARWANADRIQLANKFIREEIRRYPGWQMIDMMTPLLGRDGRPRRELFENDGLHLNAAGYQIWQQVLAHAPDVW